MTTEPRIRVLVVDDSAFARKVLRQALEKEPRIQVVGIASDGLEALEKISELEPDVVTLDLMMPNLDGIGVLRELSLSRSRTRVLIVSISNEDSELVIEALQLGAIDLVKKPTALATDRLYELSDELVQKVLASAGARTSMVPEFKPEIVRSLATSASRAKIVVVGTSTGGPQALTRLISSMPADFPVPIAIALHIPAEYTEGLARRLDQDSELDVVEAQHGLRLRPGLVLVGKGGIHLRIDRDGAALVAHLSAQPAGSSYFPSVDVLFESASAACGAATLGVVLTGMGDDGVKGANAIVEAGGRVLTEAGSSCVIDGMPRRVREAGLSSGEARIEMMSEAIVRSL